MDHGIRDTSDIWYKIFQGKKNYYDGHFYDARIKIKNYLEKHSNYPYYIQNEIATLELLTLRHITSERDYPKQLYAYLNSRKVSNDIKSLPTIVQYIHYSEYLNTWGQTKFALGILIACKSWLSRQKLHYPEAYAITINSLISQLNNENNPVSLSVNELALSHNKKYKVLKPYFGNNLSNFAYLHNKYKADSSDVNQYFIKSDSITAGIKLNQVYNQITRANADLNNSNIPESSKSLENLINTISKNCCDKLCQNAKRIIGRIMISTKDKQGLEVHNDLLKKDCTAPDIKALVAYDLALSYNLNEEENIPLINHYINKSQQYFSEIYRTNNVEHYSSIINQLGILKLSVLMASNKLENLTESNLYNILATIENIKNRSIRYGKINFSQIRSSSQENEKSTYISEIINNFEKNIDYNYSGNSIFDIVQEYSSDLLEYRQNTVTEDFQISTENIKDIQSRLNSNQVYINNFHDGEGYIFTYLTKHDLGIQYIKDSTLYFLDSLLTEISTEPKKRQYDFQDNLEFLSKIILSEVDLNSIDHIIVNSNHIFEKLPFELLFEPETNNYILLTKSVSYISSVEGILNLKNNEVSRKSILFSLYSNQNTIKDLNIKELPELHSSILELDMIKSLRQNYVIKVLSGSNFTKKAFKNSYSEYGLLHFNTHSNSSSSYLYDNYLYFRDKNGTPTKLYGFQINQFDFHDKTIILGSCNSGSGKALKGEGTISISRHFLNAGANSVIKSIWEINDKSSSDILKAFYDYIQYQTILESLMEAKRKYIRKYDNSKLSHPYYWSSMIYEH